MFTQLTVNYVTLRSLTSLDLAIRFLLYTNCLRRHNQPNLNVSTGLQTLFYQQFHVKSILK